MQFWERDEGFEDLGRDESFQSRLAQNKKGIAMFEASPLFGIGIGNSQFGGREFETYGQAGLMIHNTYLQALAETGLVGFTLLMVATLVALWRMRSLGATAGLVKPELRAYAIATELSLIAFMVASLANGFLNISTPYLIIAIASATRGVALAEPKPERS